MLRVSGSVVVKQLVIRTSLLVNFVHVLLNNSRKSVVIRVACLTGLEEDIRVLSGTSLARMVGIQGILTELGNRVPVSHLSQVLIVPGLDLLDLVGSAETVKEVDKGNLALNSRQMSNCSQIHNFLHTGLTQHSAAGLTAGIHIGVIAENRQRVAGQSTGRHIDNARKLLAGNLVQVGNHQKQTLGSGVGSRKSASGQRAVNRAGGTCLGLHLRDLNRASEDVLSSFCRPLIHMLRHDR